MDPQLSPVMVAILVAPFIVLSISAATLDIAQSRRNSRERVIGNWGELRITHSFLIVGYRRNARRISLAGATVRVTETGSPADGPAGHQVHVTVANAEGVIVRRSQPHSYGSSAGARMFEILFNRSAEALATPTAEPVALRSAA